MLTAEYTVATAREFGFRTIAIDGGRSAEEIADVVAEHFGLVVS